MVQRVQFCCDFTRLAPKQTRPCLYTLRDGGALVGVLGVHVVDHTALGGCGSKFTESLRLQRERFPYRKWRRVEGEFCGAWYHQHDDFSITMGMKSFADKIRSINIPKNSSPESPETPL